MFLMAARYAFEAGLTHPILFAAVTALITAFN